MCGNQNMEMEKFGKGPNLDNPTRSLEKEEGRLDNEEDWNVGIQKVWLEIVEKKTKSLERLETRS